ncbi:MAG TPA: protein kinase [Polyangiaceae bacterium]
MRSRIVDGKYEIVRELSKGGMGAVYEARHVLTRRRVALKLILAETLTRKRPDDALRRFEREARAAGSIESRHVVSVLDTGVDVTTRDHYIVMELLFGDDLRELLRRSGKLPPNLVLSIARQVCIGLRRAHDEGIVHRDIKPANIYLARSDDGHIDVKILDFGIAKLRADPLSASDGNDLTRSGSVLGSPLYMSPEQATGSRELDARSDIWSLGVVMYEALSGQTPHANRALGATLLSICSTPARPVREREPTLSPEVAAVVHKALALEPGQRFATAHEMQRALEALGAGGTVLHESMLRALPAASEGTRTDLPVVETPEPVSDRASTPEQQTTVDAVTYGSGSTKRGGSRLARRRTRSIAVLAGIAGIGAMIALSRSESSPPLGAANASTAPPPAVVTRTLAAQQPVPPPSLPANIPSKEPRESTSSKGLPSAALSVPPAVVRRRSPSPRAVTKTDAAPPAPSATPAPAPTQPLPRMEPAIDRRFD